MPAMDGAWILLPNFGQASGSDQDAKRDLTPHRQRDPPRSAPAVHSGSSRPLRQPRNRHRCAAHPHPEGSVQRVGGRGQRLRASPDGVVPDRCPRSSAARRARQELTGARAPAWNVHQGRSVPQVRLRGDVRGDLRCRRCRQRGLQALARRLRTSGVGRPPCASAGRCASPPATPGAAALHLIQPGGASATRPSAAAPPRAPPARCVSSCSIIAPSTGCAFGARSRQGAERECRVYAAEPSSRTGDALRVAHFGRHGVEHRRWPRAPAAIRANASPGPEAGAAAALLGDGAQRPSRAASRSLPVARRCRWRRGSAHRRRRRGTGRASAASGYSARAAYST